MYFAASDTQPFPPDTSRDSDLLTRDVRDRLREVQPAVFLAKVLLLCLLLTATSYAIIQTGGVLRLLAQVLQGGLFAHSVELVHQCLHRTGTGRRAADYALGTVLAWPAGVSFWYHLYWHLWHHANNGTEEDAESFGYAYDLLFSPKRSVRLAGFLWHVSQLNHYGTACARGGLAVTGRLAGRLKAASPKMPDHITRKIQRDYQYIAVLILLAVTASIVFRTSLVLELWLVPLLIGYGPFHALIELPEHFLCDRPSGNVFDNTRSIKAGLFGRWLTNNNGNHIGHHLDPMVPLQKAPALEAVLKRDQEFKYYDAGYPRYYWGVARFLWTGSRLPEVGYAGDPTLGSFYRLEGGD
jgi:fatty acid desaturase